jgi:mono/diheme cytochrome c family protein
MLFPFGVIASTRIGASRRPGTGSAKRSPAANCVAEIASSRFALLAMTLLLVFAVLPARAAEGDVDQGRDTYQDLCSSCHGRDMVNAGTLSFDLRKFPKDDFARFKTSVLNGKGTAMPAWAGKVSDEDLANLWAYVKSGG